MRPAGPAAGTWTPTGGISEGRVLGRSVYSLGWGGFGSSGFALGYDWGAK